MKKLIITMEFPPQIGGIASYTHQFASALKPEEVVILASKHKQAKEFDANCAFKVVRHNFYFPPFIWPRWLKLFWHVFWLARKEKIDIIYLHHVLPVGYVARLIKKFLHTPFLIFSHGTDVLLASRSNWKKNRMRSVVNQVEAIIFNSASLRQRFLRVWPEFADKSLVLYPCPDDDFYQAPAGDVIDKLKSQYALEGKKVILTIARMDDGKGYPHLVRILSKVLEKVPNLVWLVIGDGPKCESILKEIQKNFLQNVVRYIGMVPHKELKQFYYLADLFVLLTHPDEGREEGLGLVFLESAAAGLPVIAGRSGGVEEAVLNGQTGLVVDIYQGDKIVADSIIELLKNEKYAKNLGMNARMRLEADFKWENQLKVIGRWV
ncbi:MAG: glycosyltransferase family 4 protein [Candidatus Magasanikbacteria bacterium]|nr:glycosyltransferase family 4 protein [Candidatus Magasanikbacteria bacterium]